MGLFPCLNALFAPHRSQPRSRRHSHSHLSEKAGSKSMASELDKKEMMLNDDASYNPSPRREEERVTASRSAHSTHTTHSGILQYSSSFEQLEHGIPSTPPLNTAPSTPSSPPLPSSNSLASIGRPPSTRIQRESSHVGSPKSTRSKISFTGSEGTFRSTGAHTTPMTGKMVGTPTHFQTSDGRQELSSRLYTSDNTKSGRRKKA